MASDTVGFSAWTIHWAFNYVASIHEMSSMTQENITDEDIDDILSSDRGTAFPYLNSLVLDEQFQNDARIFIHQNACKKGEPNLTVEMFAEWFKSVHDKDISVKTANRWLHKLGFSRTHHQKGVYFDGHERDDVVENRNSYISQLAEMDKITICKNNPSPILATDQKPLIRVVHDKSTFYANCDQSYIWANEYTSVLKPTS